jgi:hypothetical protein
MTRDDFLQSISAERPPEDIPGTLASLWWDRKGDWDRAHAIAQTIATRQGSAVHAYLHREEGVLWNADYWYRRAGRRRPDLPLEDEWDGLVSEVIATSW